MTRVFLIRHAQSEGNMFFRSQGCYNAPVSPRGMEQIALLEKRFAPIPVDAVYASDLVRTQITARAVADPKGLPIRIEPQFRELNMGIFENLPVAEFFFHPSGQGAIFREYSRRWDPQGGETFRQVADRSLAAFFRIANQHPGKTVCIFTHGTLLHCFQAALRGKHPEDYHEPEGCENTGVSCYEVEGDRFRILFENDASHLPFALTREGQPRSTRDSDGIPYFASFQPMALDTKEAADEYRDARQDVWVTLYGSLAGFDGNAYLEEARAWDSRSLARILFREEPVGILQLATLRGVREGIGHIPFLYLKPAFRRKGLGGQALGQALYTYRDMGRKCLQLQCAPENLPAQRFYRRYGFVPVGKVPGVRGSLDLLQRDI